MRLALLALAIGGFLRAADPPPKLSPEQIRQAIESGEKVMLLDVREPKELAELGTLKGYINIPLGQIEQRLAEIPKEGKLLVFCNRAHRAATAAETLQKNGYSNIIGLGAMNEWKEKKFEVVYPEKP